VDERRNFLGQAIGDRLGQVGVVQDIDRKLRLTAALLGTVARKDLAAAFRRVNPNTSFDVGRADKWLQGRARPRELQLYEDWARVLGLDRPGRWIADCDLDVFVDEIAGRHGRDRAELVGLVGPSARKASEAPGLSLAGTYVCYSNAWSPYFRGRLIRGALSVASSGRERVPASYVEVLPTGPMRLDGWLAVDKRAARGELGDATRVSQHINFALFPPTPPFSVMGGLMFGTTLIGPDAQPSVTRTVLIRLPQQGARLASEGAYLPVGRAISEDLEAMGLPIDDSVAVDRCLATFLGGGGRDGIDQVPAADHRALVDVFDRIWLGAERGDPCDGGAHVGRTPPGDDGKVRPFPRRPRAKAL
jgi:hypothetical protein